MASTGRRKPVNWSNVAIGSGLQFFEVTTLGQPLEVLKTQVAAHRKQSLATACRSIYARGGVTAFWQGLYPWAWIEAVTKGGVLLLAQSEIEHVAINYMHSSKGVASALGGIGGGVAQAYTTMGFCTFMKTVEVTRAKGAGGATSMSTTAVARDIFAREGVAGMYKGVSAVALRQASNWGSRFGISRAAEAVLRGGDAARPLTGRERLAASVVGGACSVWNHPFEVVRVEAQRYDAPARGSGAPAPSRSTLAIAARIYRADGLAGLYRGVVPRIALSAYLTVVMVYGGDEVKALVAERKRRTAAA